jgi:hypothetical protein
VLVWAVYNAVWYAAILPKATNLLAPGMRPSPRAYAKGFASLMMPNLVPLLFPVSRWGLAGSFNSGGVQWLCQCRQHSMSMLSSGTSHKLPYYCITCPLPHKRHPCLCVALSSVATDVVTRVHHLLEISGNICCAVLCCRGSVISHVLGLSYPEGIR